MNASDRPSSQSLNPQLRTWVEEQLAAGHSTAALRASLRGVGWREEAIEAVLKQAEAAAASVPSGAMPGPDLSDAPLYIDAVDRRVQVLQVLRHPRLMVFGNLLSGEECDGLIETARPRLARSLTVETQTGGEAVNVDRTSDGMFFSRGESALVTRVERRIAALLNWPMEFGEGLQVLRYRPGTEYRPHYDYFNPHESGTAHILRRGGQRLATLLMYLQSPESGGATVFPDIGLEIAPQRGVGVFFSYARPLPSTHTLHGGAPVRVGEKWVATKWLRESRFV